MGFASEWIELIMMCVLTTTYIVLVNGRRWVMSVKKYSLHIWDLACLCSVSYLNNRYFCYFANI